MPTQERIVMERFFDEVGDMHLVIHSVFGSRLNRAWGLALLKRFCRKFNFELQAAATEEGIILSLGSTHSFPLEEVFDYLNPTTVREVLIQALLDSPMFQIRWRWNAANALAIPRRRNGKRVAPILQRMQAEDLIAVVFPDQLACVENIAGERELPDHPIVNQTIGDCLHEAMDVERLEQILKRMQSGEIEVVARDLREPSPLSEGWSRLDPMPFWTTLRWRSAAPTPFAIAAGSIRPRRLSSACSMRPPSPRFALKHGPRFAMPTSFTTLWCSAVF
jgi:ATP-dependent Lhr-like helicase